MPRANRLLAGPGLRDGLVEAGCTSARWGRSTHDHQPPVQVSFRGASPYGVIGHQQGTAQVLRRLINAAQARAICRLPQRNWARGEDVLLVVCYY